MKAVVLNGICDAGELKISEVAIPEVKKGWVLIKVKAFGLNHSELILRKYEADAPYIQLPIIPGIECVGEIANASDSEFKKGEKVVAVMGGMGRSFNGSYAEFALLPVSHVFSVKTNLDWCQIAAIPESFLTAYGSLFECLQLDSKDILFIHGATSALGLASIQLAKAIGCTVIGSTRKKERLELLNRVGAEYVVLDDDTLQEQVRELFPQGITKILELIGMRAIKQTSILLRKHGILCSTGQLGGNLVEGFDLIKNIPNGVYLTSFYSNYPSQEVMDSIFRIIDKNRIEPIISKTFNLEEIAVAHKFLEDNDAVGKIVITV